MAFNINDITGEIVDASLKIHKTMGAGLYEKVYEDCLCHELEKRKLNYERQKAITAQYEDLVLPSAFKIDLLVENSVIIELKSIDKIHPIHECQILTYMRLSKVKLGLLINFNVPLIKDGIKRFKI